MEVPIEQVETMLHARRYLYTVYQSLLGSAPTLKQFEVIDVTLVEAAYSEMGVTAPHGIREKLILAKEQLETLKTQYTRYFEGPGKLPASLWESVYITGEQSLFQRATLEVRNAYRASGFLPQCYPSVADDHIAIELDFLRALADRACNAHESHDEETLRTSLEASALFLEEHLLAWIDKFAKEMTESDSEGFYPHVAQAAASFAENDQGVTKMLLAHLSSKTPRPA